MKLLVLTSCTNKKLKCDVPVEAEVLYEGDQHKYLMVGIEEYRKSPNQLDFYIMSAQHGIIQSKKKLDYYNFTFKGMKKDQLKQMAQQLDIPKDFKALFNKEYDAAIILLGKEYLMAAEPFNGWEPTFPVVVFAEAQWTELLNEVNNVIAINASQNLTSVFNAGVIALKGRLTTVYINKLLEDTSILKIKDSATLLETLKQHHNQMKNPTNNLFEF